MRASRGILGDEPGTVRALVLSVLLWIAILCGYGMRIWQAFHHGPMKHIFSDPQRHWDHAKATVDASPMALIDPPVFQMWVSLVQKVSLGEPRIVCFYAAAMSVVTPWLWYRFVRESVQSRTVALFGWALLAWLPSWHDIFTYFMTETLFLPLMGASLWQTARAERNRRVSSFCGMVALWTLTGMTRGIAIPMAGVAGAWVWLRQPAKGRKLLWSGLIVAALMGPIAARNHYYFNLASPLGSGWLNQIYAESGQRDINIQMRRDGARWGYQFGSPSYYAKQFTPISNWTPQRRDVARIRVDLRKGAADWKAASTATAKRGWERLRLRLENVLLVMFGESWPDNNPAYPMARAATALRWVWAPAMLLLLALAVVRRSDTLRRPLLPLLMVTWFVFQAPSLYAVNEGRYRKPLEGLVIVQMLVVIDAALARRAARRRENEQ